MFRKIWCAAAFAAAVLPAYAQDATREEVRKLKQQVDELDKRVQDAENAAAQAATQAASRPQSESAMNPAVSVILNGVYGNLQRDPNTYRLNGFVPTMGEVSPGQRGFSLGESELAFTSNIDHLFRGTLIASITPEDSVGVEEGYLQTLALSNGFTVKAGRFFSGVGYQNQIHAHAWDFTDAPLANKVFLGNQLGEDGVQFKWVAPAPIYLDLGFEVGRGRQFPAGPAGGQNKNGWGSQNFFTHVGGDLGTSYAWQVGLSHLRTSPRDREFTDTDSTATSVTNTFSGTSRLWVLDGVLKWAPDHNPTYNSFKLQGEYFRRKEEGDLTYDAVGASLGTMSDGYSSRQSGWYLQGVYQFLPQWRAGYRYDQLSAGTTRIGLVDSGALSAADFPILNPYSPKRHTVMVDWNPSEFSRVRLQFARDMSRQGEPDNQVFLQYIVSLGAHGAHRF
ncbi:MAG: hypothetical protein QOD26_898 [Betaproteobacteria bacterium]|jgi:hypothetical protein|nr:hypothetical protein [Betaproteobacteria bacterium]